MKFNGKRKKARHLPYLFIPSLMQTFLPVQSAPAPWRPSRPPAGGTPILSTDRHRCIRPACQTVPWPPVSIAPRGCGSCGQSENVVIHVAVLPHGLLDDQHTAAAGTGAGDDLPFHFHRISSHRNKYGLCSLWWAVSRSSPSVALRRQLPPPVEGPLGGMVLGNSCQRLGWGVFRRKSGVSNVLRSKISAQGRFIRSEQAQSPKGEHPKGTNPAKPPSGGRAKWHVNSKRSAELP